MKSTTALLAAALVLPALRGHAASLDILSGFDGMQSGTIDRESTNRRFFVPRQVADQPSIRQVVDTNRASERIILVRDGDAVRIDVEIQQSVSTSNFSEVTFDLAPSADGRNRVEETEGGFVITEIDGDPDTSRSLDLVFSIDEPYNFEFSGFSAGGEPSTGRVSLTRDEQVLLSEDRNRTGSGTITSVTLEGSDLAFGPFFDLEARRQFLSDRGDLLASSAVFSGVRTEAGGVETYFGVLPAGEYRLGGELFLGFDGGVFPNGGSTRLFFSASPVGTPAANPVPSPTAAAAGLTMLGLLTHRRRA